MSEISHGDVWTSGEASFVHHVQTFLTLAIVHLKQTTDKLVTLTVIYSIISVLAYFLYLLIKRFVNASQNDFLMKRVLIITAHPDDECMFFGPTILNLRLRNIHVSLLCLSAGDSPPNNKRVRKEELWQSCKVLGLDESHIELRQHSLLKDGHQNNWSHKLISAMIIKHIETLDIDTVITFDEQGVSEHPNHIAIFEAMAYLALNHLLPTNVCFYSLDSVNRLRKYSSMLDFLTSFFVSKSCLILSLKQQYRVVKALACHQSQFVWFRKLYILISRYATINTLKLWSFDKLKDCVKYEDMVSGLKNKNKWYKSLDDSLKKINSEQVMPVQTEEMSEEQSGPDTEDDDVSFNVKPASPLEQSDPVTPTQAEPDATVRKENESAVPPPKPKLTSTEESIHNGEVFVRCPKSRFLIPKTYRNFYNSNSSSSSSSEGSVDETATSSGSPEGTSIVTTVSVAVNNEQIEPNTNSNRTDNTSADKIISCKIDKTNHGVRVENSEDVDNGNIGRHGIEDTEKIDISCGIEGIDDEDNNESYEIEDIESALSDFDKEEAGNDNDEENDEVRLNLDNQSARMDTIERVEVIDIGESQERGVRLDHEIETVQLKAIKIPEGKHSSADKFEEIKRSDDEDNTIHDNKHLHHEVLDNYPVDKLIDSDNAGVDVEQSKTKEQMPDNSLTGMVDRNDNNVGLFESEQVKDKATELQILLTTTSTAVHPRSEDTDISRHFTVESDVENKHNTICVRNIEKKSEETTEGIVAPDNTSSNSSEQDSDVVKAEPESGHHNKRNNHRNRKRRKNKKQNITVENPDDEGGTSHEVNNKLSLKDELSIAEANRLGVPNKPSLVKQDEIDIQESNTYIGPNKSAYVKVINSDKKEDILDRNDGKVDVHADDNMLGENNQNIFNVELVGAISNNNNVVVSNNGVELGDTNAAILQPVSTN